MSDTIRTFIGIPVAVPPALASVCQKFALMGRGVKPVHDQTMHITLNFLGDTRHDQVQRVGEIVREHTAAIPAGSIAVRGLNAFPNRQRPAIVWAALPQAAVLKTLADRLATSLEPEGFAREVRAYTPHLTLARVRAIKDKSRDRIPDGVLNLMTEYAETDFGSIQLSQVVLYQSVLSDAGPTYTALESIELTS